MPVVRVIPQKINPLTKQGIASIAIRRVAAYARVSTDSDEQFTSFEAQVDYYTKKINELHRCPPLVHNDLCCPR